mgnify:CR=1 FL=1
MLISEMIKSLQSVLEENGDQELFIFVDTPDDTAYISKIPEIKVEALDIEEFNVLENFGTNGKILTITNLNSSCFDEDYD